VCSSKENIQEIEIFLRDICHKIEWKGEARMKMEADKGSE
jgi:hypothetical protein